MLEQQNVTNIKKLDEKRKRKKGGRRFGASGALKFAIVNAQRANSACREGFGRAEGNQPAVEAKV